MKRHTLVLAVASVALSTIALNDGFGTRAMGQVPTPAPVSTPPSLSAPSSVPQVTPSNVPVAAPSVGPSVTPGPSTSPTASNNPRGVVLPGMAAITASTLPSAANQNGTLTNPAQTTLTPSAKALTDQQAVPAAGTLGRSTGDFVNNGLTGTTGGTLPGNATTQQSSGSTATGEQPIPGTHLDRDDVRVRRGNNDNDADDMLLHNRSTGTGTQQGTGTNQSSSGSTVTGQQAIPSGSRLDNDDLLDNGTNGSVNSQQGTTGAGSTQGTETLPGAPGMHRFVDPNRHDAFKPLAPPRTPSVAPNSAGGAVAPAPSGSSGK